MEQIQSWIHINITNFVALFNLPANKRSLCHNQWSNLQHSLSHDSALTLNQTASSVSDNKVRLCPNPPDWRSVENHSRAHRAYCRMCCCRWSQRLARMDVTKNQLRNYLPPINRWSFTRLWVGKKNIHLDERKVRGDLISLVSNPMYETPVWHDNIIMSKVIPKFFHSALSASHICDLLRVIEKAV